MSKLQTWMAVLLIMFGTLAGCGTSESEELDPRLQGLDLLELEANCDHAQDRAVKGHKVAICHIPPGNPANAHTIVVSKRAQPAHLAHGDVLGGCSCDLIDHPGGGPGNSGGTPGNKNGGPHSDPGGDDPGDGDDADDGDDGPDNFTDPEPTTEAGSGGGTTQDDGSTGGGDGSTGGSGDGDPDSFDDPDGSGGDTGGGGGLGDSGVCDPDQILCGGADPQCPNLHACDLGCCVYVIL